MNYIPKKFNIDKPTSFIDSLLLTKTSNIANLRFVYESLYKNDTIVYNYKNWLDNRINELSIAFFNEGKPILIKSTGGVAGCVKRVDTETVNNIEVTNLYFCFGCTNHNSFVQKFMDTFNAQTLINLKP